jgi:hypothetical protein
MGNFMSINQKTQETEQAPTKIHLTKLSQRKIKEENTET